LLHFAGVTKEWRDQGVHVFAVGIGPSIKPSGLVTIAGNKENAFEVPYWENLGPLIETLKDRVCGLREVRRRKKVFESPIIGSFCVTV
jgi:hypothetical protein